MGCEQHHGESNAIVQAMYLSVVILTFGVLMVNSARHTGNHLDPIDTYLEGWMAADPRLALSKADPSFTITWVPTGDVYNTGIYTVMVKNNKLMWGRPNKLPVQNPQNFNFKQLCNKRDRVCKNRNTRISNIKKLQG